MVTVATLLGGRVNMAFPFPMIAIALLAMFSASVLALVVGWNHPEKVLPSSMHPTPGLARVIYSVLAAWLLGGAIVFFFLSSLKAG